MEPTAEPGRRPPGRGPNARQRKREDVLAYVRAFREAHKRLPTQREAARATHQDTRNLAKHWDSLTAEGLLPPRVTLEERRNHGLSRKQPQVAGEALPPGPAGQILDDVAAQLRGFVNRVTMATAKEKEWGTRYWQQRLAEIGQLTEEAFTLTSGQQVEDFIRQIQR